MNITYLEYKLSWTYNNIIIIMTINCHEYSIIVSINLFCTRKILTLLAIS